MEPITLATVTAAVVNLALEAAKDVAPQVVKETWAEIKGWLGWSKEPSPADLAPQVAEKLDADPALAQKVVKRIKPAGKTTYGSLVGRVDAEKVIIQTFAHVEGGVHQTF